MSDNIDPREMRFCVEYALTMNGTQSAREAGFPPKSAHVTASRLLKRDYIQQKVRELQDIGNEKLVDGSEVTRAKVIQELDLLIREARKAKQFGPAIRAAELKGKSIAMFTDRVENTQSMTTEAMVAGLDEMGVGDLGKIIAEHIMEGRPSDDGTIYAIVETHWAGKPVDGGKIAAEVWARQCEERERQKRLAVPLIQATH